MKLSKIKDSDVVYGGEEFAVIRNNSSNLEGARESDLLYIDIADDWGEEEHPYLFQCIDDDGHLKDPTPDMRRELKDLFSRFVYTRDSKIDRWKIHKTLGTVKGDCEDFVLTLLWQLSGRSMWRFWWNIITFRAVIWHVMSYKGEQHAVLWYRGMWADNMECQWYTTNTMRHKRMFPWIAPFMVLKLLVGKIVPTSKAA